MSPQDQWQQLASGVPGEDHQSRRVAAETMFTTELHELNRDVIARVRFTDGEKRQAA